MPENVISKKEITIPEVKAILEKIDDPNQFQLRTLDYANKFSKLEPEKAWELVDKIVSVFDIDRVDAVQIVNSMPSSIEELRPFFAASRRKIIMTTRLSELLNLINEYRL